MSQRQRRSNANRQGYIPQRQSEFEDGYDRAPSIPPTTDKRRLLLIAAALLLIAIAIVVALNFVNPSSGITLAQYNKLHEGMPYEEVSRILGSPGKLESEEELFGSTIRSRSWIGNGGKNSGCIIMFNYEDKIHLMTQNGLR